MATNNALNTSLSGQTGTGNFVGSLSPSITTPALITGTKDANGNNMFSFGAAASAVNYLLIANNSTGLPPVINAIGSDTNIDLNIGGKGTGGVNIFGDSAGNAAPSSVIGQLIDSLVPLASAISLTSNVAANVTSIILQNGNYDLYGNISFVGSTNNIQNASGAITSTSATFPDVSQSGGFQASSPLFSNYSVIPPGMPVYVTSGPTTIYLVALALFGSGTVTACGQLIARRRY